LTLDEVCGILNAATAAEWKAIAGQRLAALDEQIAQLQHARGLLAGALWCRFDHPATDCNVMGAEIDRRLGSSGVAYPRPEAPRPGGRRSLRHPTPPGRKPPRTTPSRPSARRSCSAGLCRDVSDHST